jgi:hypothetical protein
LKNKVFNINQIKGVLKSVRKSKSGLILKASFTAIVDAQEAKAVAPLSPLFGQFGLSCPDFCKRFNEVSINHVAGLPLKVKINVRVAREFDFSISGFRFIDVCFSSYDDVDIFGDELDRRYLLTLDFYKLILIFKDTYKISFEGSMWTVCTTLRAMQSTVVRTVNDL